jgi:hypothetical protein
MEHKRPRSFDRGLSSYQLKSTHSLITGQILALQIIVPLDLAAINIGHIQTGPQIPVLHGHREGEDPQLRHVPQVP